MDYKRDLEGYYRARTSYLHIDWDALTDAQRAAWREELGTPELRGILPVAEPGEVNRHALFIVADWIEDHQDEWDQNMWNRCFAGITCQLGEFTVDMDGFELSGRQYGAVAREFLGLDEQQSERLFSEENDLGDILLLVFEFTL
jgi:hypothetical protein